MLNRLRHLLLVLPLVLVAACQGTDTNVPVTDSAPSVEQTHDEITTHPVTIVRPPSSGGLTTSLVDISGAPASIACRTCHEAGSASAFADRDGAPADLHKNIALQHGDLVCQSCHDPDNVTRLRLASGVSLPIEDAITLCSQCHGTQRRDYDHGAHGGMRGYWDLTKGPRERNTCTACHAAHAPAYPNVYPAPGPIDRFAHPTARAGSMMDQRFSEDQHE